MDLPWPILHILTILSLNPVLFQPHIPFLPRCTSSECLLGRLFPAAGWLSLLLRQASCRFILFTLVFRWNPGPLTHSQHTLYKWTLLRSLCILSQTPFTQWHSHPHLWKNKKHQLSPAPSFWLFLNHHHPNWQWFPKGAGNWTQGLTHTRQTLLNTTSSSPYGEVRLLPPEPGERNEVTETTKNAKWSSSSSHRPEWIKDPARGWRRHSSAVKDTYGQEACKE